MVFNINHWKRHWRWPLLLGALVGFLYFRGIPVFSNWVPPPEGSVVLKDDSIKESSGLARSHLYAECFWTHNDSGDSARLFLIDLQGETRSVVALDLPDPIDWEDMASFEWNGEPYLAVGDIGGNAQPRKTVLVHILPEPQVDREHKKNKTKLSVPITFEISIDGGITNFESLAVDPSTKVLLLVEKSNLGGRVFTIPLDMSPGIHRVDATVIGQVALALPTACDVSANGRKLAILSYSVLYVYERTTANGRLGSWEEALKKPPQKFRLPKLAQAEAVCFDVDDHFVYLTSEQTPTPLVKMPLVTAKK